MFTKTTHRHHLPTTIRHTCEGWRWMGCWCGDGGSVNPKTIRYADREKNVRCARVCCGFVSSHPQSTRPNPKRTLVLMCLYAHNKRAPIQVYSTCHSPNRQPFANTMMPVCTDRSTLSVCHSRKPIHTHTPTRVLIKSKGHIITYSIRTNGRRARVLEPNSCGMLKSAIKKRTKSGTLAPAHSHTRTTDSTQM